MPKKVSYKKGLGIAGKDVVAVVLVSEGLNLAKSGDWIFGGAMIIGGGVLFLIQAFL